MEMVGLKATVQAKIFVLHVVRNLERHAHSLGKRKENVHIF